MKSIQDEGPVTPVRHRVTVEGNSLTAAERNKNRTRQCLSSKGDLLFLFAGLFSVTIQTLDLFKSDYSHRLQ